MEPLRLESLARLVGGRLEGAAGGETVHAVSIDTRSMRPGGIFVALGGTRADGHHFLPEAFVRGAGAAIIRADWPEKVDHLGPAVRVADPRATLARLAAWNRRRVPARVVAVTGSAGKTTVKDLLAHLLESITSVRASPRSYNNDLGVPLTLLGIQPWHAYAVVEIGVSHRGEMDPLARQVRPEVAVFTSFGPAHLAGLGSSAGVLREKLRLAAHLLPAGVAVAPHRAFILRALRAAGVERVVTFGRDPRAVVSGRERPARADGVPRMRLANGREVRLWAHGRAAVESSLAALAVLRALDLDAEALLPRLETFEPRAGRLGRIEAGPITILDDSYNANPLSVEAGLDALRRTPSSGRRIAVLGAMAELGRRGPAQHRLVGRTVARSRIDLLITVGSQAAAIATGAREGGMGPGFVHPVADCAQAQAVLSRRLRRHDLVWIKASRSSGLERLVESLARHASACGGLLQDPWSPADAYLQAPSGSGTDGGKGTDVRPSIGTVGSPPGCKGGSLTSHSFPPALHRRFRGGEERC